MGRGNLAHQAYAITNDQADLATKTKMQTVRNLSALDFPRDLHAALLARRPMA